MKRIAIIIALALAASLCHAQGTGNRNIDKLAKTPISLTASGTTLLGTTDNGTENFYPMWALINISSSNYTALTVAATISIGTVTGNYTDIMPTTVLTGMYQLNKFLRTDFNSVIANVPPNTAIYLKVTAITGTGTTLTATVTLYGDYK